MRTIPSLTTRSVSLIGRAAISRAWRAERDLPSIPVTTWDSRKLEQKALRDELRVQNQTTIEEGIDNLNNAIQLRPGYDDAMAYMNLLYRERADLECDNPAARKNDLALADHWVDLTLAVKKAKAEKPKSRKAEQEGDAYGTQSAMKILVSCGALPFRFEAHTSFFPSGENIGNPSNPSL